MDSLQEKVANTRTKTKCRSNLKKFKREIFWLLKQICRLRNLPHASCLWNVRNMLYDTKAALGDDVGIDSPLPRVSITTTCPSSVNAFVTCGLLFVALYPANSAFRTRQCKFKTAWYHSAEIQSSTSTNLQVVHPLRDLPLEVRRFVTVITRACSLWINYWIELSSLWSHEISITFFFAGFGP